MKKKGPKKGAEASPELKAARVRNYIIYRLEGIVKSLNEIKDSEVIRNVPALYDPSASTMLNWAEVEIKAVLKRVRAQ